MTKNKNPQIDSPKVCDSAENIMDQTAAKLEDETKEPNKDVCTKRYLLFKGWCGFGDRLQCLSQALDYAKSDDRILCIDWTDSIWGMSFDKYFMIVDFPYITYEEFLAETRDIEQSDRVIHPACWCNQIDRAPGSYMFSGSYGLDLSKKYPQKVVVYAAAGDRKFYTENLKRNLRVRNPYRQLIIDAVREVRKKGYDTVVHLRGTDRVASNERASYIETIANKLTEVDKDAGDGSRILIVSDSKPLVSLFQQRYPAAGLRTPVHVVDLGNSNVGVHMMTISDSRVKDMLNTETLIDFFVMSFYAQNKRLVCDGKSFMSTMSTFLSHHNTIDDILGWP